MKTATIFSLIFALSSFALVAPLAYASEVTGQLISSTSSAPGSGSQVSGTFGGGSSSSGSSGGGSGSTITGTVSGGSSGSSGGSSGGGGGSIGSSAGGGGGSIGTTGGSTGSAAPVGQVLGASTENLGDSSLIDSDGSVTQPTTLALNTSAPGSNTNLLGAAAVAGSAGVPWWLWLLLFLVVIALGGYASWRYSQRNN